MPKPLVWTIAGSDPSSGAGIQADLHCFKALNVQGCSAIAALTAQNSRGLYAVEFCSQSLLKAQLDALIEDFPPAAVKLGMVASQSSLETILPYIKKLDCPVVYDPVLFASVGGALYEPGLKDFLLGSFLAEVDILTPNIPEAEWLLNESIRNYADMERAAKKLLGYGLQSVLIKGGHLDEKTSHCQDFWTDGQEKYWLISKRQQTENRHGTGCTLSSAITAYLAQGYELKEALVLAKAYLNQAIRLSESYSEGPGAVCQTAWLEDSQDFPIVHSEAMEVETKAFLRFKGQRLGFYPIVDSSAWVLRLLKLGVQTIQLRIKDKPLDILSQEIVQSIELAKQYDARLFINDHWELALAYGAYAVHLGQEDIETADLKALQQAGIRLGISTHSYYEIARALYYKPSYIACGPIFHTNSKAMKARPQGISKLAAYSRLLDYPLVAIGGIKWGDLPEILQTGVSGIAVITAITNAKDPDAEIVSWQRACLQEA